MAAFTQGLFLLSLWAASALAQNIGGSISGQVLDSQSLPIDAAGVEVLNLSTGLRQTVATDRSGRSANAAQSLNVTAEVTALRTDTPDCGSSYNASPMNDLPMLGGGTGRNFRTQACLTPVRGAFGTLGRNMVNSHSQLGLNIGLHKNFTLTERTHLEFRAEMFNLSNTVNYNPADGVLTSPNFGQSLTAGDPRQTQLALRLSF